MNPDIIAKALDLAKPIVETGCELVECVLGKPCKVAGDMLADQIYAWQWSNRLRILEKASKQIQELKGDKESIPTGFFLAALDSCGNIENEDLQGMWANLIANSARSKKDAHPAFIDALKTLSGDEARVLQEIANGDVLEWSPELSHLYAMGLVCSGLNFWTRAFGGSLRTHGTKQPQRVTLTGFGKQFYEACTLRPFSGHTQEEWHIMARALHADSEIAQQVNNLKIQNKKQNTFR